MEIIFGNKLVEKYIDDLLVLEEIYHPNLQESANEKKELYTKEGSLMILALEKGHVVGECSGLPVEKITEKDLIEKIPDYEGYCRKGSIYIHSFTALPDSGIFGVGKNLALSFIQHAKDEGYNYIIGHARQGVAKHVNSLSDARIIKKFENWYDTKEDYYFSELALQQNTIPLNLNKV